MTDISSKVEMNTDVATTNIGLKLCENRWRDNVINPFYLAYKDALSEYNQIVKEQQKANQQRADFAYRALSLCGGNVFTSLAVNLAVKSRAKGLITDYICQNNLTNCFKAAHLLDSNPAAQFVLGEAWKSANSWMQKQSKQAFMNFTGLKKGPQTLTNDSDKMKASLTKFYGDCEEKLLKSLMDINTNQKMSDKEKRSKLKQIFTSPFAKAPERSPYPTDLKDQLLLCFLMRLVLASDEWVTRIGTTEIRKPVTEMPTQSGYPTKTSPGKYGHSKGYPGSVEYSPIGDKLCTKINERYQKYKKTSQPLLNSSFWEKLFPPDRGVLVSGYGHQPNQEILKEAEKILTEIGNMTAKRVGGQINNPSVFVQMLNMPKFRDI